ncbi:unnamed protein product [Peronospora farinosa]|uniref:Uncharacterized protein n=1 Tax=Peronospora farinosa TaxID=134698 RepID=A0AAV0SRL9_9STRA|nr:unnamed protein product [Peronospora farinosa]CAI5706629.1 unnamed protein product [Peronospora farinosa]
MEAFETTFSVIGLDYKDNLETILPILQRVSDDNLDKVLIEGTQIERVKPIAEELQIALKKRQQDGKLLLRRKKRKNSDLEEHPPAKRQNSKRPPGSASTSKPASDLVPDPDPAPALASGPAPAPDPAPVAERPIIDLNKLPDEWH